jgi:hypothetical protein
MGGTTAKASVIEGGDIKRTGEFETGGSMSQGSRLYKGGGFVLRVPVIGDSLGKFNSDRDILVGDRRRRHRHTDDGEDIVGVTAAAKAWGPSRPQAPCPAFHLQSTVAWAAPVEGSVTESDARVKAPSPVTTQPHMVPSAMLT